jgi:SAM-dependent methyltransferase
MNFFNSQSAAGRYPRGRPYFHPLVVERIRSFLPAAKPIARAVDVGCGTGLSAVALKSIAAEVVGVDAAPEMVALAERRGRVRYALADALRLPFGESEFDLMTLSSAFHWLEREKVLKEAYRVLRPGGWLVVYDNYFSGRMEGRPAFQTWYVESYLTKYPPPPRAKSTFGGEDSGGEDFHLAGREQYQNSVSFSVGGLVDYLTTQSNVIAAVEGGGEDIEGVRLWLRDGLNPLFGDLKEAAFPFHGPIWYLQSRKREPGAGSQ